MRRSRIWLSLCEAKRKDRTRSVLSKGSPAGKRQKKIPKEFCAVCPPPRKLVPSDIPLPLRHINRRTTRLSQFTSADLTKRKRRSSFATFFNAHRSTFTLIPTVLPSTHIFAQKSRIFLRLFPFLPTFIHASDTCLHYILWRRFLPSQKSRQICEKRFKYGAFFGENSFPKFEKSY